MLHLKTFYLKTYQIYILLKIGKLKLQARNLTHQTLMAYAYADNAKRPRIRKRDSE